MLIRSLVAGDQYGNYLIQYILIHADPQRREIVAAHIRCVFSRYLCFASANKL